MGKKADQRRHRKKAQRNKKSAQWAATKALYARRRRLGLISYKVVCQLPVAPDGSFTIPDDEARRAAA